MSKVKNQKLSLKINRWMIVLIFAIFGSVLLIGIQASQPSDSFEAELGSKTSGARNQDDPDASGGTYVSFGQNTSSNYEQNLAKIMAQPWRNTNEDDSPYRYWTMEQINEDPSILYGPKSDYNDGGFAEHLQFPWPGNAAMRTGCEFSHFAYDDPIVFPNQPEEAHLHMFFGNTHVNAFTTHDTLWNSGGGTCNGGELNRTGYWAPAVFDDRGNVRIPDIMNLYYKHDDIDYQLNNGHFVETQSYPIDSNFPVPPGFTGQRVDNFQGVRIVSDDIAQREGVVLSCINETGGDSFTDGGPVFYSYFDQRTCPGGLDYLGRKQYVEVSVMFQNCWNGQDPSLWESDNMRTSIGKGFFGGPCPDGWPHRFPNIRYRMRYTVEAGEDTSQWYLSSDVSKSTLTRNVRAGSSNHGDWWGGWNPKVNQMWIDNCNNTLGSSCAYGFLDAQPVDVPGPAMRYRNKYNTPGNTLNKVPAQDVYDYLCSHSRTLDRPEQAAYCTPG